MQPQKEGQRYMNRGHGHSTAAPRRHPCLTSAQRRPAQHEPRELAAQGMPSGSTAVPSAGQVWLGPGTAVSSAGQCRPAASTAVPSASQTSDLQYPVHASAGVAI